MPSPTASPTPQYTSLPPPTPILTGPYYLAHPRSINRTVSVAKLRPWEELFALYSFTLPCTLEEATSRSKRNLNHFRVNYAMVCLVILFLSLLWHPISVIVFLSVFVAWFFLFFFRDEPVAVSDYAIDDRVMLAALGVVTVVALLLTSVWLNVLVSILIGAAFVGLHSVFRSTDDLYVDEQESLIDRAFTVVGSPRRAGHTRT